MLSCDSVIRLLRPLKGQALGKRIVYLSTAYWACGSKQTLQCNIVKRVPSIGSGDCHNLTSPVLYDDQIAIHLLSRIHAYHARRVEGVEFDAARLHKAAAKDDVEVGLFAEIDIVSRSLLSKCDWPLPNLNQTSVPGKHSSKQAGYARADYEHRTHSGPEPYPLVRSHAAEQTYARGIRVGGPFSRAFALADAGVSSGQTADYDWTHLPLQDQSSRLQS